MKVFYEEKNRQYLIENGHVYNLMSKVVVELSDLYQEKNYDLLKLSFTTAGHCYHAYVIEEIKELLGDTIPKNYDIEFLHDTIVKLWLKERSNGITVESLIKRYINDPDEYKATYEENIGNLLESNKGEA